MDPSQIQPGHRLDRYELLCPLAYGGMASVWLARFGGRLGFERLVVVKMILPQFSQDPRFQEMFLDEARIASKIEHGNVARILDVGEHDGNTFIVMEWVDGDSLSKIIRGAEGKRQTVPIGIALRICADAAAGLHAAHALKHSDGSLLGVVHRDVSPQNILVSNAGQTMIIDFGVAKARDRVSQDTSAGQLKGKIRYMAPEQALGRAIDHRADVWALGSILYELVTGTAPFDGPNEVATLHKLTSGQPPPPLPPHVPPAVRAIIQRALTYESPMRFATSLEMNQALESAMVEVGELTTASSVATYTGQLLADRKLARKKAVEQALAQAHLREGSSPNGFIPRTATVSGRIVPIDSASARAAVPLDSFGPMAGRISLHEIPSGAASATLGSASMESIPTDPEATQRRRFVNVAIGVSLVAGIVGAGLIATSQIRRAPSVGSEETSAASTLQPAVTTAPPPPVALPPTVPGAAVAPPPSIAPPPNVVVLPDATTAPVPPPSVTPHPPPRPPVYVPPRPPAAPASSKKYGF